MARPEGTRSLPNHSPSLARGLFMSVRSTVPALSTLSALIAVIYLVLTANPAQAQRLSSSVHPEHYNLTLTPDLHAATFSGEETIDLLLDAPGKSITLNAAEIK